MNGQNAVADADRDRWLAYELHDGLLQWIVGARMQVDALLSNEDVRAGQLEKPLGQVLFSLRNALEEGRELIGFLERKSSTAKSALESAMQQFVEIMEPEAQRHQQQLTLSMPVAQLPLLDEQTSWNLLRIAQQAVRNAIQHAGPCKIDVRLTVDEDAILTIEIHDDGQGFDAANGLQPANHFGMESMRHRATLIGAELSIDSQPGAGCSIVCRLKLAGESGGQRSAAAH